MMDKKRTYLDSVHLSGRIWCIAALIVMLTVPTLMSLHLKAWPDLGVVGKAFGAIALLYYPTGVVEVLAYAPLLGAGGTYLSFLTGNIVNELLGSLADSRCLLLYLDTVLIGTGLEAHVKALELLVSCDTIGEDDLVGVSDVRLARCVGDGRCDVIRFLSHF